MIIGLDTIGSNSYSATSPIVENISSIELKNSTVDYIKLQNNGNIDSKETWSSGTILLATFNDGGLEAGNIRMNEGVVETIRIKRRRSNEVLFNTIGEKVFLPEPTTEITRDYGVSSAVEYEYVVVPVDASGIEGFVISSFVTPRFEGWWLVDPDEPDKYNFQFLYNLDDVSITVSEDRTELNTFGKFPKVYYGQRYARKGSLSGLFIPEFTPVKDQYEKLVTMLNRKKPYILKDGYGRNFLVDVSAPSETVQMRLAGTTKVSIDWVEVGEANA